MPKLSDDNLNLPSYARPNIASRLPEYSNHTAELIKQAFVPCGYTTISKISGAVLPNGDAAPFRSGGTSTGTFSDFTYVCSPVDLSVEQKLRERKEHTDKMTHIAGSQPFFAGYNTFQMKYESPVYEFIPDPYDAANEFERQQRFLSESRALSKPFVPPGRDKALERPTRVLLGDMMAALHKSLLTDWPDVQPTVLSTAEDLIVVYFNNSRATNSRGVVTYMNNALRRNEIINQYDLRKVPEGWDINTEDGHLMFTLRPPWVRARNFLAD